MFHRVIRLARAGVRALFVFDGPHRPSVKRGHRIYRGSHSIQKDFERIVEAFGFEGRTVSKIKQLPRRFEYGKRNLNYMDIYSGTGRSRSRASVSKPARNAGSSHYR